jgi:hypothetical protein
VPWGLLAAPDSVREEPTALYPSGGGKERNVSNLSKTIKWRAAAPVMRAGAAAGTVIALIAVVGAPWKWI